MLEAVRNAFRLPDLRQKLLITFGLLTLYRLAANIPLPGVDQEALAALFSQNDDILLNLLNFFSGGGLSRMGVMALGVYPYITASIILQLLIPIIPALEALSKEGEQGRSRLNQYTLWLTIPLAVLQAIAQGTLLAAQGTGGASVLPSWGFTGGDLLPTLTLIIGMTAGTMLGVWLGQLITEQGVGNGVSLIIFAGIVSSVPTQLQLLSNNIAMLVIFAIITVLTVILIVWIQEGQRRIPVQYGKRVRTMRGNRMMMVGGQSTYVPLRVNTAGMIPLIFAQSLLILPSTLASYFVASDVTWVSAIANAISSFFNPNAWAYWLFYFLLTVIFTYFYTDVLFRQQNLADTLQKQGGFIPGIRPGPRTESYLNGVLQRITLVGALFLGFIAVLPFVVGTLADTIFGSSLGQITGYNSLIISSSGLLIVVGVVLDTMKQIEAQLTMRNYEGFIR
jgi:preprotein translocase subunit SecY